MSFSTRAAFAAVTLLVCTQADDAQLNPSGGEWEKAGDGLVRVMTWNVEDAICRTNDKSSSAGDKNWEAVARIVAALRPDVLCLQEAGDNVGNGTGTNDDSVSQLLTTLDLFLHGGSDPFNGGLVGEYVQKYAPSYDLPHVFVSSDGDNFNRNVILSRWPFVDLNGDGKATLSDMPPVLATEYVTQSGDIEPRGTPWAEIDLPDVGFLGDLVVGNSHLKAGSAQSDVSARILAGKRLAYFVFNFWGGGGTNLPDPHGKILDSPPALSVLPEETPVVSVGDFNDFHYPGLEDGMRWASEALLPDSAGGMDGPDSDGSDLEVDSAKDLFSGTSATHKGGSKLDYITWEGGATSAQSAFVFNTGTLPSGAMPPELSGFTNPASASGVASDHRPVVTDLVLGKDTDGDGVVDGVDNCPLPNPGQEDLDGNGVGDACEQVVCQPSLPGSATIFLSACGDIFQIQVQLLFAPTSAPAFLIVGTGLLHNPLPILPGTGSLLPKVNFIIPFTTSAFISTNLGSISGGLGPASAVIYAQALIYDPQQLVFVLSNGLEITVFN